ncbi:MAG: GAF domain-containing protein [Crenarchaeota archaeon]|nr:GAF domain-containing protein [Thermoproteota archaeon]
MPSIIEDIRGLPSENTGEFLKRIVDKLRNFRRHYTWVGIYMVENGFLVLRAFSGDEETSHVKIRVGEGVCGLAAQKGETIIVPDVSKESRYIECFPSTKSEIVVPILIGEKVAGEIDIDSDLLDAFDDEDRLLLEEVARIIAETLAAKKAQ